MNASSKRCKKGEADEPGLVDSIFNWLNTGTARGDGVDHTPHLTAMAEEQQEKDAALLLAGGVAATRAAPEVAASTETALTVVPKSPPPIPGTVAALATEMGVVGGVGLGAAIINLGIGAAALASFNPRASDVPGGTHYRIALEYRNYRNKGGADNFHTWMSKFGAGTEAHVLNDAQRRQFYAPEDAINSALLANKNLGLTKVENLQIVDQEDIGGVNNRTVTDDLMLLGYSASEAAEFRMIQYTVTFAGSGEVFVDAFAGPDGIIFAPHWSSHNPDSDDDEND